MFVSGRNNLFVSQLKFIFVSIQVCEIWLHGDLGDDAVNVHSRSRSDVEVRAVTPSVKCVILTIHMQSIRFI